ncbi:MAG: D-glycero-beta-D-manno-heptose-7-phosphate kinase [Helicobacteraceae bacterium]|jgi:D-beta-D-heptose 7-phosphate kinase/D-beta-D-heptose 1-phosphate adenosyltransferase|nr:D-glycero-beta-D-manno-heptose-7-phosphate kinase [Helicobacteraceae bacterium]
MRRLANVAPRALVVGDLMLDVYLWGKTNRISPEAPVPVVEVGKTSVVLGGAGNVIGAMLALGAKVFAAGVIGDDRSGAELKAILENSGADSIGLVEQRGRKTGRKTRLMASHRQIVRFDSESVEPICAQSEEALKAAIENSLPLIDVVLLSDYGKGVLTNDLTQFAIGAARALDKMILIDPKGADYSKYRGATLITPNRKEAGEAIGGVLGDLESVAAAGAKLRRDLALDYAIITLSEDGMTVCGEIESHFPTQAREVYDVTGAGDTVLASLGFALAAGMTIAEAAHFANVAAAVAVSKIGGASVTIDEILAYEYRHSINQSQNKIAPLEVVALEAEKLKKSGRKVVFTNGCFDLLHRGHIEYLRKSREEGDALIVGLNSDKGVKALKGESRPIVCEEDRAYTLSSLSFVDYVVIFDDPTPIELVKAIKPDVLTKGGDYKDKKVIGSEYARKVVLVDLVEGRSTSETIAKIIACGGEK